MSSQNGFGETQEGAGESADAPEKDFASPPRRPPCPDRFEFDVTEDLAVSDLLVAQLGECTRMIRSLSDRVLTEQMMIHERTHTIASVADAVNCSGKLVEWWDRLLNHRGWYTTPPSTMVPRPRSAEKNREFK